LLLLCHFFFNSLQSLAEMETRSSELEQMIASAQEAAAEAAAKADQELGVQTSEVEQSTREVRQRVAAEAAKAEAARNHLKDRKIQLADVVARNEDSSKRGDAFEKNVRA
jgi:FtsZ-interacting cell division protein ZipA